MSRRQFIVAASALVLAVRDRVATASSSPVAASLPAPLRLPVWLDGRGPFSFIFDTGASRTALAAHCLPELPRSTAREQQVRLQTPSGSIDVPTVAIAVLRAGDGADAVSLGARRLPVLPRQALKSADGLLGADALAGASVVLDFVAGTIALAAHAPAARLAGRTAMRATSRRVEVPVQIDTVGRVFVAARVGRRDVVAMLDTGALRSIAAPQLLQDAPAPSSPIATATGALRSATGTLLQATDAVLPAFRIGSRRWPAAPGLVAPLPAAALAAAGSPGETLLLIGLDRLSALEGLTLDYARARLTLSPLRVGRG